MNICHYCGSEKSHKKCSSCGGQDKNLVESEQQEDSVFSDIACIAIPTAVLTGLLVIGWNILTSDNSKSQQFILSETQMIGLPHLSTQKEQKLVKEIIELRKQQNRQTKELQEYIIQEVLLKEKKKINRLIIF